MKTDVNVDVQTAIHVEVDMLDFRITSTLTCGVY